MKDRNVQHASRFRLTKVPGTDDVYDLIPAPGEVYEEGTLINKSALLKDSTAALFGLDENAVPDDALALLSRFQNGLGNEYVWMRNDGTYVNSQDQAAYPPAEPDGYTYKALGQLGSKGRVETGGYIGTGTYGASNPISLTFEFEPKFLRIYRVVQDDQYWFTLNHYDGDGEWNAEIPICLLKNQTNSAAQIQMQYHNTPYNISFSNGYKTMTLYSKTSAAAQLNISSTKYYYIAIG